jgi:hypothetical protein
MDLSTGGDSDAIRQAILDDSPVPIGTVPIYQAEQTAKEPADLTPQMLLDIPWWTCAAPGEHPAISSILNTPVISSALFTSKSVRHSMGL